MNSDPPYSPTRLEDLHTCLRWRNNPDIETFAFGHFCVQPPKHRQCNYPLFIFHFTKEQPFFKERRRSCDPTASFGIFSDSKFTASSTYRWRDNKSCQSCQTVGRMVWVASRVWNPNLLKQFTEANDPVKQMLAGLNKSLEADNWAIINRVVKAEHSISEWEDFKDNHAINPHRLSKELQN